MGLMGACTKKWVDLSCPDGLAFYALPGPPDKVVISGRKGEGICDLIF